MLNGKEKKVMQYLFYLSGGKQTLLVDPADIIHALQPKYDITDVELNEVLEALTLENYIDVVNSDKDGKLIYCITLKAKGESFERDNKNRMKNIYIIITRTVVLACLSFVVGLILNAIFG